MLLNRSILGIGEYVARVAQNMLGYQDAEKYFYLASRKHWDVAKFTNICGQYDGKAVLHLHYTSSEDTQNVAVKTDNHVIRILVIGTSTVEGYRVILEQKFCNILQQKYDEMYGHGKYEIINGGIGGYVSYQLLVYFQEVLLRLKPDIVLLYLGRNNVNYNARFHDKEYYEHMQVLMSSVKGDKKKIE